MRRAALLLVPLFLFACDREPVAPEETSLQPSASANGGWELWYQEFGPGEFVFPAECIGEEMQFTGKLWFNDHFVTPPGAPHDGEVHDNWEIWTEGTFESLTTGNEWFVRNSNNHGIWWGFTPWEHAANHEFIWLDEDGTDRAIRTWLWVHVVQNANDETKVEKIEFTCIDRGKKN